LCENDLQFSSGVLDSASPYCVCRPGYILDTGTCRACQKGTYKEQQGNTTLGCANLLALCCQCGEFQTTASEGSTVALAACVCIHGHGVLYQSDFACLPCPHGTYKEETDRQLQIHASDDLCFALLHHLEPRKHQLAPAEPEPDGPKDVAQACRHRVHA